ncbi:MAG: DUF1223 domain-containing protein [Bryobacterales bacterium]|nr:DUF1223 domain-containing protein [Bryobacterales bacterium]MBV9401472.1 DUF1223 domain-containing protein [Bryobacterales bacterium]
MMTRFIFAAAAVAASALAQQQRAPVVVELFTSEGCSSCPPADTVLARLDREQPVSGVEVIALGEHVDYWDHEGWRDRFSSALFTARQQDYGQALKLESVYTPQMVINGQTQVLGSDWNAANNAIRAAAQAVRAMVSLRVTGWDTMSVQVRELPKGTQAADMFLAIAENGLDTSVFGGENNGRRLRHSAVVRTMTRLGNLDGKKSTSYAADTRFNVRPEWNRQNLRLVFFLQERGTRKIVGAAAARL